MSTETEEKTSTGSDTQPGRRHIFCGICYPHHGPGVGEAFCGITAPYDGVPRTLVSDECEECVEQLTHRPGWGCPKCNHSA